jgi:hypothetical protein
MDTSYYRQREQAERAAAHQAHSPAASAAHLALADSYRGLVEAYERLEQVRPRNAA